MCWEKGVVVVVCCWKVWFRSLIVIFYMVHKCGFALVVSMGSLGGAEVDEG